MSNMLSGLYYRNNAKTQKTTCSNTREFCNYDSQFSQNTYESLQVYQDPAKQMQFSSPMSIYDYQNQELPTYECLASPDQVLIALLNERSSPPQTNSFVQQLRQSDDSARYGNPSAEIDFGALFDTTKLPLSPISMKSSVEAFERSPLMDDNLSINASFFNQPMCYSQEQLFPEIQHFVQSYYGNQPIHNNVDPCYQPQMNILAQQQPQQHPWTNQTQCQHYHQEYLQYQYQQLSGSSTFEAIGVQGRQRRKRVRRRITPSQLQCATCFKTFTRPYNLKSHQRTHTKERPFVCLHPGCGKTFARPHDLKRHDFLHSGIKPHKCACGKRFARSDAFKRHQTVDAVCGTEKMDKKSNARRP